MQATWHVQDGRPEIIDLMQATDEGLRGMYSGMTLREMSLRYKDVQLGSADELRAAQQMSLRTQPQLIDEASYNEALGCLPPLDWRRACGVESFKLSEFYAGDITTIYANHPASATYWKFRDVYTLSAEEIANRILTCISEMQRQACVELAL